MRPCGALPGPLISRPLARGHLAMRIEGTHNLRAVVCIAVLFGCTKNESQQSAPTPAARPAAQAEQPRETTPEQDTKMANQPRGIPQGKGDLFAIFQTSAGSITCRLLEQEAPETVANFVGLATGNK